MQQAVMEQGSIDAFLEKLEKSYDLWEKTETFGVEQRVRLYCMFISGGQSESG